VRSWPLNLAEGLFPRIALGGTRQLRANGGTNLATVRTVGGPRSLVTATDHGDVEEISPKDKHYRKYASGVDRALSLFDTALEEWADYISFLNRLLKVRKPHVALAVRF